MSNLGEETEKVQSTSSRADRLKEIDALYRSQIKQIYNQSKESVKEKEIEEKSKKMQSPTNSIKKADSKTNFNFNFKEENKQKEEEIKVSRTARSP